MALSTQKMIEELNELIRFDFDAVGAYNEAIKEVKHAALKEPLTRFCADHERHISDLSAIVRRLGAKPVEKPDWKGMVRKTMTKIAGVAGSEGVLMAMKSNERALNQAYDQHAQMDFPKDILDVIQRNFADEKRHLAWVEDALRQRLWEQTSASVHP